MHNDSKYGQLVAEYNYGDGLKKGLFSKSASAELYEGGLVYTTGKKITEVAFADIKGIKVQTSNFSVGDIQVGTIMLSNTLTICKKEGSDIVLFKSSVPNFMVFAVEFSAVFSRWLLKDLTMDNISGAQISFGKDLELRDGQFIFKLKGENYIPLGDIASIEEDDLDGGQLLKLFSRTKTDKKGRPELLAFISVHRDMNLEAFYHIAQMAIAHYNQGNH